MSLESKDAESMNNLLNAMYAGLPPLLDEMRSVGTPFNAFITHGGSDVPVLALEGNGVGWEAVYDHLTNRYDLWKDNALQEWDLSLKDAARRLLDEYANAKATRIVERMMKKNPSADRKRLYAQVAIEVRQTRKKS
jgi:hypothetical protein